MKPAGLLLLIPAGLVAIAAASETTGELVSRNAKARIREGLPAYQPPAPKPDAPATDSALATDPDVLVLPKMIVKERRLPPGAADHLMSKDAFNRKMENLYLDNVAEQGPLNAFLNRIAIPILNPITISLPPRRGEVSHRSVAIERGRALYRAREIQRLEHVADVSKALDPAADKKAQQEIDNTHTTRPAGDK